MRLQHCRIKTRHIANNLQSSMSKPWPRQQKSPRKARHGGIEARGRVRSSASHRLVSPGLDVLGKEGTLSRQVTDSHVVARNQVAHDLAQVGDMVLGLGQASSRANPRRARSVRKRGQGLFVQEARQVVRCRTQTPRACRRRQTARRTRPAIGGIVLARGPLPPAARQGS